MNGTNPTLTWQKSPSSNVNIYTVQWLVNGVAAGTPVNVAESTTGDQSGYSTDFASGVPSVTLKPGDVVSATIVADDTVDSLLSSVVTSNSVTEPTPPPPPPVAPQPPQNVQLSLV